MAISVKLEVFEGPLDLLLHLIDKNKIDIYDIPIVEITSQYMDYIRQMQREDLNIMSEFLVMAATLLDIKCRMLLPKEDLADGEEEEDPRAELVEKLLEYKMYKYMSYELRDREMDASKAFYRGSSIPKEIAEYRPPVDYDQLVGDTSLTRLNEIFQFVLKRQEYKIDPIRANFGKIEKEEIDLDAKEKYVSGYLRTHRNCSFTKLLEKQKSKEEIIVTFLLILEMMKTGKIEIEQKSQFGDIMIYSRMDDDEETEPDTEAQTAEETAALQTVSE